MNDDAQALPTLLLEVLVGAGTTVWAWDALIHPQDRVATEQAFGRHLRGETERYECEYRALAERGAGLRAADGDRPP